MTSVAPFSSQGAGAALGPTPALALAPAPVAPRRVLWSLLLRHQLAEQAVGIGVALLTVPGLLLRWWSFEWVLSRVEADGGDPRRMWLVDTPSAPLDVFAHCLFSFLSIWFVSSATLVAAVVVMKGAGCVSEQAYREARRVVVAVSVLVPSIWVTDGYSWMPVWAALGVWAVTIRLYVWVSKAVSRACALPLMHWRLSAAFIVGTIYLSAFNFILGEWFVADETTDGMRVAWLLLVQPVIVECICSPVRVLAREFPTAQCHHFLVMEAYMVTLANLVERWMVTEVRGSGTQVMVIVAVTLKDVVMRLSVNRRDRAFVRRKMLLANLATESEVLPAVKAMHRTIEEISDVFATVVVACVSLVFRLGHEKKAPSPWPILLSMLLQLLVEAFGDLSVGAVAIVWADSPAARPTLTQLRLRAELFRKWPRRVWVGVTMGLTATALWYVGVLMRPSFGSRDIFCAWSQSSWGWHWVPCAQSEAWLSAST